MFGPVFDTLFWAEFVSKIILIIVLCLGGSLFLHKSIKKAEISSQKYLFLGIALFGYSFALTRFFFLITDFLGETHPDYLLFWKLAFISTLIAILFLELIIETYLVKTYYIFSAICIFGLILLLVVDLNTARIISYPLTSIFLVNIIGIYVYVGITSEGDPRTKAFLSCIGILILVVGVAVDGTFAKTLLGFDAGIIGAVIMIVGISLYFKANY
ncbi:MAG: hypothetical protein ACTSO9_09755 [Candidatus Helarchaeota archaeon]